MKTQTVSAVFLEICFCGLKRDLLRSHYHWTMCDLLTEMNLSTATASVVYTEAVSAMLVRVSSTGSITGRIWGAEHCNVRNYPLMLLYQLPEVCKTRCGSGW